MREQSQPGNGPRALLRFLAKKGRLQGDAAVRLEEAARAGAISVFEMLEREGLVRELELAELLAASLRLRLIDLESAEIDPRALAVLKESLAAKYEIIPVRVDEQTIEIATANPLDVEAIKAVEFATGRRVQLIVTTRTQIQWALRNWYRMDEALDEFLSQAPADGQLSELHDDGLELRDIQSGTELPPVVKLAEMILVRAAKSGASDIHVEPTQDAVVIRYRIDGVLEEGFRLPKWVQPHLIGRFKIMARLDIAERRVPQDGRTKVRFHGRVIDFRVSSLPTQYGEKVTLRQLDAGGGARSLEELGFSEHDLARLRQAARRPEGMILVTGPTGSGKTTTLYAVIRELHSVARNIITLENPIEYRLKGINQVEVNEKQGLTFAGVLRSVLRQDPDVILVGEIRDAETARIAFQAAQTGHLVLSTLHTNDAAATVTRLIDLGVEPYVVASSLHLVIAQRLVRRACAKCAVPEVPDETLLQQFPALREAAAGARRGRGCPACRQTGFDGRIGVYETLALTPAIAKIVEATGSESAIRQRARQEGMRLLLDDAVAKLRDGVTTVDEVARVVQIGEGVLRCHKCGHEVEEEFAVCPRCSARLQSRCLGCKKPLNSEWATCPYCGARNSDEATPSGPPRTYKALVVDDNVDLRHLVRTTLERAGLGLSVVTAQNGAEALELAALERPDVVIMDLQMPEMDGVETCRRLRAHEATAFVPILMLTAMGDEEHLTRAFEAGVDDYLVKPLQREQLVLRVRRMLERTFGAEAAAPPR
ncbi:MAG TPA: ATPase, T2SS/T4P/T4SS family [Candidatus Limnocylindria bacterium]|nr:ATPase, T2SS/T4P/T4SS family [Candidatus Limnocylindria bacterium]